MRPNLSLESIAGALAVLGTGVIMAACGGDPPKTPVNANEVSGAGAPSADGAGHKPGEASCSADKKGADAKPADPAAPAKPDTTPAAATPAAATPAAATPAAAPTGSGKKPAAPAPAKKAGASSCGAGTCSAKK